jgi:hypothetical protein
MGRGHGIGFDRVVRRGQQTGKTCDPGLSRSGASREHLKEAAPVAFGLKDVAHLITTCRVTVKLGLPRPPR